MYKSGRWVSGAHMPLIAAGRVYEPRRQGAVLI